jgi:hypothetical protein
MNYKRCKETDDEQGHRYHFTVGCTYPECTTEVTITVKGPDLFRYHNRGPGQYVQTIFPYLSASEREMLFMTGICNNHDEVWGEGE